MSRTQIPNPGMPDMPVPGVPGRPELPQPSSSSAEPPRHACVHGRSPTWPSRCVCGAGVGPFLRVCPRILSPGPRTTSISRTYNRMFSPHSFSRFLLVFSSCPQVSPDREMSPATISPSLLVDDSSSRARHDLGQPTTSPVSCILVLPRWAALGSTLALHNLHCTAL